MVSRLTTIQFYRETNISGKNNLFILSEYVMLTKVGISEFLDLSVKLSIIDVRSPGEYNKGHIPGSFNIPLFDDNERSDVGKKYKKINKEAAVLAGLEFVGPKLVTFVKKAQKYARNNKILVHCWRGGMRSENMAWLFQIAGLKPYILSGGYKAYRQFLRNKLSEKGKIIILAGKTGSGKTELLYELQKLSEQVINLEELANHKGSAFGAIGQENQPTNEQFTNNISNIWSDIDKKRKVWIEDESKNIGAISIPHELYKQMSTSPVITIEMLKKTRINRLMKEYSFFKPQLLEESILKIQKRLGGLNTSECVKAVREKKFARAIDISLTYYDKAYLYGLKKKQNRVIAIYNVRDEPANLIAQKIIDLANEKLRNKF